MNFDGQAIVMEFKESNFISTYGYSDVVEENTLQSSPILYNDNAFVRSQQNNTLPNSVYISNAFVEDSLYGDVPHTVEVRSSKKWSTFFMPISVKVISNTDKKTSNITKQVSIPVTLVDRTNIYTESTSVTVLKNTFFANVLDATARTKIIKFPITTMDITDKSQVIIVENTSIGGMSVIIQKNSFTEFKFDDIPAAVSGIPDGLVWNGQSLKGTITKSGSYNVVVSYATSEQVINIIVPYYERLL